MLKPPLSGDSTAKRVGCVRHAASSEALKEMAVDAHNTKQIEMILK
jgi:hypothetical protein